MSYAPEELEAAWKRALNVWEVATELSVPEAWDAADWDGEEPLAYIDLRRRQVVVNYPLLEKIGARDSLTAVFAHEIGHHVRFPHSLGLSAELEVLQHRLIPGLKQSLTNLFFDLQVNEFVGRTDKDGLARVYQGFVKKAPDAVTDVFFFYLAIYEELWGFEPGTLVPEQLILKMEGVFPGCRVDARVFAQTFYDLPTVHLQFIYFCSRVLRYISKPDEADFTFPLASDVPTPSAEDLDGALQRSGALQDSIESARKRGWLNEEQAAIGDATLQDINALAGRRPGTESAPFRELLVERHYARLVDRYLIPLPDSLRAPEPELITTTEPWELGDAPGAVDWNASVLRSGPLAPLSLLKRSLETDGPPTRSRDPVPALELYLDTSGSMPDPSMAINAMTLAALVLATSALRRKARVRAVVYSTQEVHSGWMYDEWAARKFLLQYAGAGTAFPFPLLEEFMQQEPGVIRVVISDNDFLWNAHGDVMLDLLERAAMKSERMVYLLNAVDEADARRRLGKALKHPRARLAVVRDEADLAKTAAVLADALIRAPVVRR